MRSSIIVSKPENYEEFYWSYDRNYLRHDASLQIRHCYSTDAQDRQYLCKWEEFMPETNWLTMLNTSSKNYVIMNLANNAFWGAVYTWFSYENSLIMWRRIYRIDPKRYHRFPWYCCGKNEKSPNKYFPKICIRPDNPSFALKYKKDGHSVFSAALVPISDSFDPHTKSSRKQNKIY